VTNPGRAVYRTYEPVSLIPTDGWRAVFWVSCDPDDGPPWDAKTLIAWGVYDVTENPVRDSVASKRKVGREVHGVVCDADGIWPVPECHGFWRYLPPGEHVSPAEAEEAKAAFDRAESRRQAAG
jgi:hypothetical protein